MQNGRRTQPCLGEQLSYGRVSKLQEYGLSMGTNRGAESSKASPTPPDPQVKKLAGENQTTGVNILS